MARVDDSGARAKAERLYEFISRAAVEATRAAQTATVRNAQTRTPTVKEEYDLLMEGDGKSSSVPMDGGSSAQGPDDDYRIRLQKDLGTYLEYIVPSEANQEVANVDGVVWFRFGRLSLLTDSTYFHFVNESSQGPRRYEKGPYFQAIEGGSVGPVIRPVSDTLHGGKYPLRPDFTTKTSSMSKPIKARNIFGLWLLEPAFKNALISNLSALDVPGHPGESN